MDTSNVRLFESKDTEDTNTESSDRSCCSTPGPQNYKHDQTQPIWSKDETVEGDNDSTQQDDQDEQFLSDSPPTEPAVLPYLRVVPYDPAWPRHFDTIKQKLSSYLGQNNVHYTSIEHVGSTSVPGLAAKPNIDIIIEVPDSTEAEKAKEALIWEPAPEEHYKCIGDGGIQGRISMKLHERSSVLDQSVYIINALDRNGRIVLRCHRTLRDTLRCPECAVLKDEYASLKMALVASCNDGVEYGQKKNPVIRKILRVAGWSEAEIDEKEGLDTRVAGSLREDAY